MTRIGIVGAGPAGAAAACAARQRVGDGDLELTVLEAERDVGGRAASRCRDGCTYEYGANYVQSDDERVADLLATTLDDADLVDVDDPIYTFDADGEVSPGRDADEHRWTYREGLSQVAARLLDCADATVNLETRVASIACDAATWSCPDAAVWSCRDAAGARWGPFDALVLTPPAPRTAALVRDADWEHPARARLADAAAAVPFRTIFSAVLHCPVEIDVPYYALVNTDREHEVGWLAREECKPGHVPDGESLLVVQAAPDWSAERRDAPPAQCVDELARHAAALVGDDRLRDPDWTDHARWRYALPDDAVAPVPLRDAEAAGLFCAGDWVPGEARVHAAIANGLAVGERVVDAT